MVIKKICYHTITLILALLLLTHCTVNRQPVITGQHATILPDTFTITDPARQRNIPVAVYHPPAKHRKQLPVPVLFSHGYGANQGGDYLIYSHLATFLASRGYFVVSIQHEVSTDPLLPMTGPVRETRFSNWERGVQNIRFVVNVLQKKYPGLAYDKLVLMGHSNGGDMTALFAHTYPGHVHKIITLDNRRMELPRTATPRVFTLRSNDYPADEGVLPTEEETAMYRMTVQFTDINHSAMDNDATEAEQQYLNTKIAAYLEQ